MQLTPQQYAQAWYQALKEAKAKDWETISQTMLRRLRREGKLNTLSTIIEQIKDIESAESNKAFVEVTTAHKSEAKDLEALVKELLAVDEVELTVKQDKTLLGGLVMKTKNHLWDLSTKNQLEQLKESLNK